MSKLIAEESDDVDNDLQGEKLSLIQHFDNSDDDEVRLYQATRHVRL